MYHHYKWGLYHLYLAYAAAGVCEVDIVAVHVLLFLVTVYKVTKYLDYNKDFYREFEKISQNHEDQAF